MFAGRGLDGESAEARDALVTAALALQKEAIEWVCAMMRSVMDAAGTVHLIPVDSRTRKMSMLSFVGHGTTSPTSAGTLDAVRSRHHTKAQMDLVCVWSRVWFGLVAIICTSPVFLPQLRAQVVREPFKPYD